MPANVTIQFRRGTSAQWTSANPVLADGEMGFETDTRRSKVGDGATGWTSLAYADANNVLLAQKGVANGVASLGVDGKVPAAQMTGKLALSDLTNGSTVFTAPVAWAASSSGGTPAISDATAVAGMAYRNTTAGVTNLTTPIGGTSQTSQGDLFLCFANGAFSYFPVGGIFLGTFSSQGALPAAASNQGNFGLVSGTFFWSNGTAWIPMGSGSGPTSASWGLIWDTAGSKDMGEFTISAAVALTSTDVGSVIGGYTTATLIADGTHTPTFDGVTDSRWVNTSGARNRVRLLRVGNSKFWEIGNSSGAPILTPVAAAITSAPVLAAVSAGQPVTWVQGTVSGVPSPTVSFSLTKNGTVVASPATSGAYSSTSSGDVLVVTQAATNAAYGGGTATPVSSDPVTVSALPAMTSAVGFGDSITYGYLAGATGQRLDPSQRWLDQVSGNLGAGTPLNQGINGTVLQDSNDASGSPRASNGRDRFVAALLGSNKKDGVFLAYGFNDARYTGAPSTFNVTQYGVQLRQVLSGLVMGGYALNKIVCVSPYYITDTGLTSGSSGFTGQTRTAFLAFWTEMQNAAKEYGVWFADTYNAMLSGGGSSLIDPTDNIHPLATGHSVITTAIMASTMQNARSAPTFTATGGTTSFTYSITAVASATSYTLEYGADGSYAFSHTTTVTTSGTVSSVAAGTYRVRVRANFSDGSSTPWAFSSAITVAAASTGIFLQETFSGTPGTAITSLTPTTGGSWVAQTGYSPSSANAIDSAGTGLYSPSAAGVYQNGANPGVADYYVEAVLTFLTTLTNDDVGIIGRADAAANTFYFFRYKSGNWQLFKEVAGTATQLGTSQPDTWTSGTRTPRLTMTGTSITAAVGGTSISFTVTDSAITAAGHAGVRFGTAQASGTGIHMTSIVASS
jgi:lysophospholipase L1-like esterase